MMTDDELRQACEEWVMVEAQYHNKARLASTFVPQVERLMRFAKQQQAVGVRMIIDNLKTRGKLRANLYPHFAKDIALNEMMSVHQDEADSIIAWCEAKAKELES